MEFFNIGVCLRHDYLVRGSSMTFRLEAAHGVSISRRHVALFQLGIFDFDRDVSE